MLRLLCRPRAAIQPERTRFRRRQTRRRGSGLNMAAAKKPISLLGPDAVRTNQNTGLIKQVAGAAMLCDHFGKMLFPQYPALRLIGRFAFPLFAYCIAAGAVHSSNRIRYLSRVVLLALISQPLYALGLAHENTSMYKVPFAANPLLSSLTFYLESWQKPSILLSLALALGILTALREGHAALALGLYVLCERFAGSLDYGINGIRFILLAYLLLGRPLLYLLLTTAFWLWWSRQGSGYRFFGISFAMRIYALPAVLLTAVPMRGRLRLPRWLSYSFYPAHLALLAFLTHTHF